MPRPQPDMSERTENDRGNVALKISLNASLRVGTRLPASVPRVTRSNLSEPVALERAERRASKLDPGAATALDYHDDMKGIRDRLF